MIIIKRDKKIKTYAFVDASNIIYGARAEGWFIDQKKLFKYLKTKFGISKAFFYYGKDSKNIKQEKFLKRLKEFGYTLRVKEIKRYGKKSKANCDVDLTMDVLLNIGRYQQVIILSGDGDFLPLIQYVMKQKKEVVVIASPRSTAREIREFVKHRFINFGNLRYFIERKNSKKMGRTLN